MKKKAKTKYDKEIITGLVLALILIWSGFYFSYPNFFELQKKAEQVARQEIEQQKEKNRVLAFGNLDLEAKAYAVYDLNTNELIAGKNEREVLPLASITKVMTVLVASDNLAPETAVTINETGGNEGLRPGEKWSLASLAALTLVSSSNEGAEAIAGNNQEGFVQKMNEKSQELGLNDLSFTNPTGLDNKPTPGGQGSALSVAKLFSYVMKNKPELLSATSEAIIKEKSLDNLSHMAVNTNEIVNKIPGLLASKTGTTAIAGGNLAVVANLGLRQPVAIVVLGSSDKGRFVDTQKLVEASLNYYSNL